MIAAVQLHACLGLVCAQTLEPIREEASQSPELGAKEWFALGLERARTQLWQEARAAFLQSLALEDRVSTRFNLSVASLNLARGREALLQLDVFARSADPQLHADYLAQTVALRARALTLVATVELSIEPPNAELYIDDEPDPQGAGPSRTVYLDAGQHHLQLRAAGALDETRDISVSAGDVVRVRIALASSLPPPPSRASDRLPPSAAVSVAPRDKPKLAGETGWPTALVWATASGIVAGLTVVVVAVALQSNAEPARAYAGSSGIAFDR